jgi:hypothetical protein
MLLGPASAFERAPAPRLVHESRILTPQLKTLEQEILDLLR